MHASNTPPPKKQQKQQQQKQKHIVNSQLSLMRLHKTIKTHFTYLKVNSWHQKNFISL